METRRLLLAVGAARPRPLEETPAAKAAKAAKAARPQSQEETPAALAAKAARAARAVCLPKHRLTQRLALEGEVARVETHLNPRSTLRT